MEIYSLSKIVALIILIPIIIGTIRYKFLASSFKQFYFFLIFSLIFDFIIDILGEKSIKNDWILHLYAPIQFLFMATVLNSGIYIKKERHLIHVSTYVILFAWVIYLFWVIISSMRKGSTEHFINILGNSEPLIFAIEGILLIILSLFLLFKIYWERDSKPYYKNEYFWFALSVFIYFMGTIILYPSLNLIVNLQPHLKEFLWIFHWAFNLVHYLFIAISFSCIK